jgi:hypothetical protein
VWLGLPRARIQVAISGQLDELHRQLAAAKSSGRCTHFHKADYRVVPDDVLAVVLCAREPAFCSTLGDSFGE